MDSQAQMVPQVFKVIVVSPAYQDNLVFQEKKE